MSTEPSGPSAQTRSAGEALEKYQLAGVDPRERGFSRPVEFERREGGFQAVLRYEALRVTASREPSQAQALQALIQCLHEQGYRQMKTQLSFRGPEYLGNRELWVEHPDPTPPTSSWWTRLTRWITRESRRVVVRGRS